MSRLITAQDELYSVTLQYPGGAFPDLPDHWLRWWRGWTGPVHVLRTEPSPWLYSWPSLIRGYVWTDAPLGIEFYASVEAARAEHPSDAIREHPFGVLVRYPVLEEARRCRNAERFLEWETFTREEVKRLAAFVAQHPELGATVEAHRVALPVGVPYRRVVGNPYRIDGDKGIYWGFYVDVDVARAPRHEAQEVPGCPVAVRGYVNEEPPWVTESIEKDADEDSQGPAPD